MDEIEFRAPLNGECARVCGTAASPCPYEKANRLFLGKRKSKTKNAVPTGKETAYPQ